MISFEEHRTKLFAIAYRMTGSAMDAEDIVQDAWLRYQQLDIVPDNPTAYLRKIVTNLSLDHLKSAQVQREQYIGEWLPEPIVTDTTSPADKLNKAETISIAFLVLLETLSPLERAVFILREVFDYEYRDIADVLNRSEGACRKVFSRARTHIQNNRPRFEPSTEHHSRIVRQFMNAINTGDLDNMTQLLAQDAVLVSDGGGKVVAAVRPLYGREAILKFLAGIQKRAEALNIRHKTETYILNGELGFVERNLDTGEPILAAMFEVSEGQIQTIRFVRNPDKLTRL